ncbi:MAG: hypothetical protein PHG05_01420 [Candidatus Nanoarchaeia archaeon]|nr:hypothetical protein [Candidatus Nanoarchaeia archaeon]
MELKEFVKNTLKEITEAVEETNKESGYYCGFDWGARQGISFDLAVVLKKSTDGKVAAEIFSVVGAKVGGSISQENVNRINFVVVLNKKGEKVVDFG